MITFYATIIGSLRHLCGSLFWITKRFSMICLPFFCAMVLYAESVRTNPINIRPSCEAWEIERCESEPEYTTDLYRERRVDYNPKTGELFNPRHVYHEACATDDEWETNCESFVGKKIIQGY